MKRDTHKTKVLFRVWRTTGEVIALFPTEAGSTTGAEYCSSYVHTGQHGSAHPSGLMRVTRPAKRAEFAPLARELRRIGYRLDIRQRSTRADYEARKAQLAR